MTDPTGYASAQHAYDDPPHVPAEPDPGIAAILERIGRAITGQNPNRPEPTPGDSPCLGVDEAS